MKWEKMSITRDKIKEVEKYLGELEEVLPDNIDSYLENLEKRLACERAFEKIIQSINDLAILIIKEKRFQMPNESTKAFHILYDKRIISRELADNLKKAMGMRNFLAHQYGDINDEIVFDAIQNRIFDDVNKFLDEVQR